MPQTQPTVCAIMLVNGREQMVRRAVKCYREQAYPNKRLLIVNSGPMPTLAVETVDMWEPCFVGIDTLTVGELRNHGNKYASHHYVESHTRPEIFVHWDSDDWSHPNRIAEQVALLQSSGKQCVGYRNMLFLNERHDVRHQGLCFDDETCPCGHGAAWLYSNNDPRYCLGTSLCYWREVWERRPFPDLPKKKGGPAEDVEWLREVDSLGVNVYPSTEFSPSPRMIASIHDGNTQYYNPAEYVARQMGTSWKRAAEWDEHARKVMSL